MLKKHDSARVLEHAWEGPGVIYDAEHEYAIIESNLSIILRDTLNELDNANLISKKLNCMHYSTSSSGLTT